MTTSAKHRKTFRLLCGIAAILGAAVFAGCGKKIAPIDEKTWDGTVDLSGGVKMPMVKVEGGVFTMSARDKDGENEADEMPHQATLKQDFYIAKTEVTQAQWKAVMGGKPSKFKGDDLPVENVSWNDAMAFCEKLNGKGFAPVGWKFSLPTETQWEYAARGGKKSKGYKFSGGDDIKDVAWYDENSGSQTHPVGKKTANELGLHDMSGNVWEWCLDDWQDRSDKLTAEFSRGNDKGGPYRAVRGASWDYYAGHCRPSLRNGYSPDHKENDLGFRVVLVPVSEPESK